MAKRSPRDYGLPNPGRPCGPPQILERLDSPCGNPECGCSVTFSIEIPLAIDNYEGGLAVGRYTGCACCCWASPMIVTGNRLFVPDAAERHLRMDELARHGLLFSAGTVLWSHELTELHGSTAVGATLITEAVNRHWSGDWGGVSPEQQGANDRFLVEGGGPLISLLSLDGLPLLRLVTDAARTKTAVSLAE